MGDLVGGPNDGDIFPWRLTENGAEYPQHEGAALIPRPQLSGWVLHAVAMKALGHRIVAELDDNYLIRKTWLNPAIHRDTVENPQARWHHLKAVSVFDALIVTVPFLRDAYAKAFKKEAKDAGFSPPPIFVINNHVDPEDWPQRIEGNGRLRIGWMGSQSHFRDVALAYPSLRWAAEEGHEAVIIGYDPAWQDHFRYTHIPWIEPHHHTGVFQLPLDIGLIPLERNEFTLGKTDLKALEYAMNGAAIVAPNFETYNRHWRHKETCLMYGGKAEMLGCVRSLVRDPVMRERLVENAAQYVREERTVQKHAQEWREAVCG